MPAHSSSLVQKIGASAVNCTLILSLCCPLYPLLGSDWWKPTTILTFFAYNMIFARRCLGMRLMGTYIEPPTSLAYVTYYTVGFSTFFYSIVFPLDLLILNGIGQIVSVALTGNTLHANLARTGTMDRNHYVAHVKANALAILDKGDLRGAVASMMAAMCKYNDIRPDPTINYIGILYLHEKDADLVRDWINGF